MKQQPIDRLSALLERFRVHAQLSFSGTMCGLHRFDKRAGKSYLHVLRRGSLKVTHPGAKSFPARLSLSEPSILFYPRATTHHFHNPPRDGTDFTCAEIEFDGGELHPIVQTLPSLIALPIREIDGLQASLDLLFAETTRVRCGQRVLADRLFEVVLIQLLRWLLDHPERGGVNAGLLVGLSSPTLARALTAIHESPESAWSLERLAEISGMSRTAFAVKFKAHVGKTPAEYLADWRLTIAQARIREGASLKLLASELGYANQSALSRVFTQRIGVSPREWLASQSES
ncbi:MAG: AraC family transcriptional regulator [Casimicrobium sp.]